MWPRAERWECEIFDQLSAPRLGAGDRKVFGIAIADFKLHETIKEMEAPKLSLAAKMPRSLAEAVFPQCRKYR
jgi:hypothetical protein